LRLLTNGREDQKIRDAKGAKMLNSKGLHHINLNVRDLRRSLKFYQDAFGLEVKFWEGDKMVFLGSRGGFDTITLYEAPDGAPIAGGGVSHFGFKFAESGRIDEAVKQIQSAGGKLQRRGEHGPGEPFAYFEDPDGYVIEIGD
jgi:lactoylglutathione lyase